jgi:Methyltransferase domain
MTLSIIRMLLDIVFLILSLPSAWILKSYRRIGSRHLPLTTMLLKRIGVMPIRDHYYEPYFDSSKLAKKPSEVRYLPGLEMRKDAQLSFLNRLQFSGELVALKLASPPKHIGDFHFGNRKFEYGDAEFLYQFVRAIKPKKIIEIGSGYSTKIARSANLKNYSESGTKSRHICVEPFEMKWLESLGEVEVVRKRVETIDMDWASELVSGDLLFIDSTHVIRPQGDVLKEYLEILPLLRSGVYVHVHDIFTPRDYLEPWMKAMKLWNEQYLLEVLLSNTSRYEIVAGLNYLKHECVEELRAVCPYLTSDCEPGSFYFRIR